MNIPISRLQMSISTFPSFRVVFTLLSSFPLFVIETFELYMSFILFWINIMGMVLLPHPPLPSLVYSLLCQVQTPAWSCWDVLEHCALCSASSPCTSVTWCSWPDLSLHLRQNIVVISYKFSYHLSNLIILNHFMQLITLCQIASEVASIKKSSFQAINRP